MGSGTIGVFEGDLWRPTRAAHGEFSLYRAALTSYEVGVDGASNAGAPRIVVLNLRGSLLGPSVGSRCNTRRVFAGFVGWRPQGGRGLAQAAPLPDPRVEARPQGSDTRTPEGCKRGTVPCQPGEEAHNIVGWSNARRCGSQPCLMSAAVKAPRVLLHRPGKSKEARPGSRP